MFCHLGAELEHGNTMGSVGDGWLNVAHHAKWSLCECRVLAMFQAVLKLAPDNM